MLPKRYWRVTTDTIDLYKRDQLRQWQCWPGLGETLGPQASGAALTDCPTHQHSCAWLALQTESLGRGRRAGSICSYSSAVLACCRTAQGLPHAALCAQQPAERPLSVIVLCEYERKQLKHCDGQSKGFADKDRSETGTETRG